MENKLKVGDRVIIDKDEVISYMGSVDINIKLSIWYSDDSYIIMEIDDDIATLNKNLRRSTNEIHISHLKLDIKTERKLKLEKLKNENR